MNTIVSKFGGSSLADAAQFRKVKEIVRQNPNRKFIVPSAPGKRFAADRKITDLLYDCAHEAASGRDFSKLFFEIKERYDGIADQLGLHGLLDVQFQQIEDHLLQQAGMDYAASRGEYLNAILLAAYLRYDFIDAAEDIRFRQDGIFDADGTNEALSLRLKESGPAVIPGFYGAMPDGTIKTFSRGGSDITGAIVARAAHAVEYENWTDVSGFLIADPRIVESPAPISTITYKELRELSYMGATVLHEDSIFPVKTAGIPIHIRNTNRPNDAGTMIKTSSDSYDESRILTGIAGKKGFVVLTLEKDMMNEEFGFGRRVLEVLERHGLRFEHLPSGIDTMSVVLNEHELAGKESAIISDLMRETAPDNISVEKDIALIAVVGRGMKNNKGTAAKIFAALANADINIRMIDQGSSELNIIVGVDNRDFEDAIRAIYHKFM